MLHGITLLNQHDNMPKCQEIGINLEIFTHDIFGHKSEKLTIFVYRFFYLSYVKLLLKKYAVQYSIC